MGKVEFQNSLQGMSPPETCIRSKRELRKHVIGLATKYGFLFFTRTKSGYAELTVRTRVKFYRKYGNRPVTKFLAIPDTFVRNLYSIYKRWPELGEFFLRTALWHEYEHLHQDPTKCQDADKREKEANKLMIEKMGRLGLIVSLWYFCSYDEIGLWDRVLERKKRLYPGKAREKVIDSLENIYPDLIP